MGNKHSNDKKSLLDKKPPSKTIRLRKADYIAILARLNPVRETIETTYNMTNQELIKEILFELRSPKSQPLPPRPPSPVFIDSTAPLTNI